MAKSISRLISRIKALQAKADSLMHRRERVVSEAHSSMAELDRAIADLTNPSRGRAHNKHSQSLGRGAALKGRKVPPKYRGPGGMTWSGRGLMPVWLREAVKKGKRKEAFLIKKSR